MQHKLPASCTNGPVVVWRFVEGEIQKSIVDRRRRLDLKICLQQFAVASVQSCHKSRRMLASLYPMNL